MKRADLHIHTQASDGTFSSAEAIDYALKVQLRAIAITDHDTIKGLKEGREEAERRRFELLPGIELSCLYKGGEVHILGYLIDWTNKDLLDRLRKIEEERKVQVREIIAKLNGLGIMIDWEAVARQAKASFINRAHIALAMVEAGYITSPQEAFTTDYIGNSGRAYSEPSSLVPKEGIELILKAKGISVLAHPGVPYKGNELLSEDSIEELVRLGLQGIEVYHTRHTLDIIRACRRLAEKFELLTTGGSDCHGTYYQPVLMGRTSVPYSVVEELKEYWEKVQGS